MPVHQNIELFECLILNIFDITHSDRIMGDTLSGDSVIENRDPFIGIRDPFVKLNELHMDTAISVARRAKATPNETTVNE